MQDHLLIIHPPAKSMSELKDKEQNQLLNELLNKLPSLKQRGRTHGGRQTALETRDPRRRRVVLS